LNIVADFPKTLGLSFDLLWQRVVERRRKPLLFIQARDGRYPLHYHSEHLPNAENRVVLEVPTNEAQSVLSVTLRFSEADADGIVRSHVTLDKALQSAGVGALEFHQDNVAARRAAVLDQARDGIHQIGTTRMGADRRDGVVNANCQTFDLTNLHLAGSSVFRTSGQANPTFLAATLAVRLAHHLDRLLRGARA
jgi:choline dehydrogenase-like flavoprotein